MVQNLQPDSEISLLVDKLSLKGFAKVNFRNPFLFIFVFQNFYAIIVSKGEIQEFILVFRPNTVIMQVSCNN